jgi:hypothetical protein
MQVFVSTALCVLTIVSNSHAWSALEHKAADCSRSATSEHKGSCTAWICS